MSNNMKRSFSTFVSVLCLLAFFVSSAACVAAAPPQQPMDHASYMNAAEHACCPGHAPDLQMSNQCCVVDHQPASAASAAESQRMQFAALPLSVMPVPSLDIPSLHRSAQPRPALLQLPPLIALRI